MQFSIGLKRPLIKTEAGASRVLQRVYSHVAVGYTTNETMFLNEVIIFFPLFPNFSEMTTEKTAILNTYTFTSNSNVKTYNFHILFMHFS